MFDHRQSFFENKDRRAECDTKLKKIKNHFKPKNVLYKLEVPPQISHHLKLCPLELQPTKLSDSSVEYYKEKETRKSKRRSKKSESKYNHKNSNQQCVDDSILTGLQTVIDLCGLLEECDKENKLKLEREKDKKNARNKKAPKSNSLLNKKKSLQLADIPNSSSSSNENNSLREQCDSHKINKLPSEPSSFRKLLIRASRNCIINKSPFKSSSILSVPEENISQSSIPSVNSLVTLITQASQETLCSQTQTTELPKEYIQVYSCGKSPNKNINSMKPIEEEPHVCSNTPSVPGIPCEQNEAPCAELKSCCMHPEKAEANADSRHPQGNQVAQTDSPEVLRSSSKRSSLQSMTNERTPSKEGSATGLIKEHGGSSEPKMTRQATLSAKCFPPLEIAPSDGHQRSLSRRTFTNENMHVVHPECGTYEEVSSISHRRHTAIYDASMLCNEDIPAPLIKNQLDVKKSRPGVPIVQPVLGFCRSAKCGGEHLKSIKYALVKISEFIGFSTYEIMKPYKDKPKQMPTCIAEIFVTSPVQKREDHYIVTRAVSVERKAPTEMPDSGSSGIRQEGSIAETDQVSAQPDLHFTCQCKESPTQKSRRFSDTSQKEPDSSLVSVHESVVNQEPPSCCKVKKGTPLEEENENVDRINSRQPILEQSVVLREFDTYREPSQADKPFQIHSRDGSKLNSRQSANSRMGSQMKESRSVDRSRGNLDRSRMEASNSPTESAMFKRSAVRTKSAHFREPTSNVSQLDNQKTQGDVQKKKSGNQSNVGLRASSRQQNFGAVRNELNQSEDQESFQSAY